MRVYILLAVDAVQYSRLSEQNFTSEKSFCSTMGSVVAQ